MILIIQICKNKLHYFEFVKPIEDILRKGHIGFKSIDYKNISTESIFNSKKIIIAGTSLKDNTFLKDIRKFEWIKKTKIPILAICGGMHILALLFNGKLKKQQEIGITKINFIKKFFEFSGSKEVYELHNFYAESEEFDIIGTSKNCPQIYKHKNKPFYGILFHPEVRNKNLILNFVNH